jgi:uncharacterized protein (TIGR00255 family)
MKSMTGYGRSECTRAGLKVTVEVSSVNRRQSELSLGLPRELEALEPRIREEINRRIARGRLSVRVTLQSGAQAVLGSAMINRPLAQAYARELAELARDLRLAANLTLDTLVRLPGVVQGDERLGDPDAVWPAVNEALGGALDGLLRMRAREGAYLARDLARRVGAMRKLANRLRRHAPGVARRYRDALMQRLRAAGLEAVDPGDARLLKEMALFAERSDITEELTRLQSHFQQFDDCRAATEPVGRTLDFLAQEMNREINTIGSKANDAAISRAVVALKAELERFREQAQNVE